MKYYAVIDTTVLVSAMLKWPSIPGSVLALALDGPITPLLSNAIMAEYREVLSRPKFHLNVDLIDDVLDSFNAVGVYVDADTIDIELPDPKDRVFYEVVMEERKQEDAYLITGNIRHFPHEPFIVTPRQMIDIIISGDMED